MRTLATFLLLLPVVLFAKQATAQSASKVTICHRGQTITISENAWSAHQQHGDTRGECSQQGEGSGPDINPPSRGEIKGYLEQGIVIMKTIIGTERWTYFRNFVATLPFVSELGKSGMDQLLFYIILLTLALFLLALVFYLAYYVLFYLAVSGLVVGILLLAMSFMG